MEVEIFEEKLNQRKAEAKAVYDAIGSVKCPYFNGEEVHFNSEGFEHIVFKAWNRTRSKLEQYTRLRLIPFAASITKRSGTMQEYDEKYFCSQRICRFVDRFKRNGRKTVSENGVRHCGA